MKKKYLEFRNFSTILNTVLLSVFGLVIGYATSKGLNLPFTAETASSFVGALILFIFSYYNAKNQNNLFDEETNTIYIPIDDLNDQQIKAINNFINSAVEENISDIDPAGDYEP